MLSIATASASATRAKPPLRPSSGIDPLACGVAPRASPPPSSRRATRSCAGARACRTPAGSLLRSPATFVDEHAGMEDEIRLRTETAHLVSGGEAVEARHLDVEQQGVGLALDRDPVRLAARRPPFPRPRAAASARARAPAARDTAASRPRRRAASSPLRFRRRRARVHDVARGRARHHGRRPTHVAGRRSRGLRLAGIDRVAGRRSKSVSRRRLKAQNGGVST